MTDTEAIGRLLMRAGEELEARIHGPSWRISDENPARLEAATRAAENARAKAAAYARGLGAGLGELLELAEPEHGPVIRVASRTAAMAGGGMPIDAGEQEVVAAIGATFALELG